jgi:dTDP-4-dehydrorhamnose 3,5-epimerase
MPTLAKTKLDGLLLIKPEIFEDHRGEYAELYNQEMYTKAGIKAKFVQDDISVSYKDVLRGIHGDKKTHKLISCLLGRFYLVIVNCDPASPQFRKWESFTLTEKNKHQVLVSPKFGVAHLALTDKIIFHYKQSTYYDPSAQFTYQWNDPKFNIWWPIKNPILSKRDELGHYV